jgi:hypothetical protein
MADFKTDENGKVILKQITACEMRQSQERC